MMAYWGSGGIAPRILDFGIALAEKINVHAKPSTTLEKVKLSLCLTKYHAMKTYKLMQV
jgi:hypothetical protein